jgi:hypothetical protein
MPLQNRVDPYGKLHAVAARGNWVGNRGVIHNERREVIRSYRLQRWITCALQFKNRHRVVFTPRRWTELFFLDEATAFAAGHRPCAECRRERYNAFRSAWLSSMNELAHISAVEMDQVLHAERVMPDGSKRTHRARLSKLPSGTMIDFEGQPLLIWEGILWRWSFEGYKRVGTNLPAVVSVLTPESTVRVLESGYRPQVHDSVSS